EEKDYFEELDKNIDEIINPIIHHRININQPISTEGIINQIKSIISQALNKY
ncbi:17526_t:CDS:1, partial [Funneliformis caledonium]